MNQLFLCATLLYLASSTSEDMVQLETPQLHHCRLRVTRGVLNIKNPANPGSLLGEKRVDSRARCRTLCCDRAYCNSYVWHKTGHCFLFRCHSGDQCPIVPNDNAETGYVYRTADTRENLRAQPQSSEEVLPLKRDNQDETPGDNGELQIKRMDFIGSPNKDSVVRPVRLKGGGKGDSLTVGYSERAEDAHHGRKKVLSAKKNFEVSAQGNGEANFKREPIATTKKVVAGSESQSPVTTASTSSNRVVHPTKASHTTTTSLIAALCFGLIFLIAVLILIGKPWYDSVTGSGKSGYTRVSFLMNGM